MAQAYEARFHALMDGLYVFRVDTQAEGWVHSVSLDGVEMVPMDHYNLSSTLAMAIGKVQTWFARHMSASGRPSPILEWGEAEGRKDESGNDCEFVDVVQDGVTLRFIIQHMPTGWMWLLFREAHLLEKSRQHFRTAAAAKADVSACWGKQLQTSPIQMNWVRSS